MDCQLNQKGETTMIFQIERTALLAALVAIKAAAEPHGTLPILASVLIEAEGATVSFRATDLDVEARVTAPAMIERSGAAAVSVQDLHQLAKRAPKGCLVRISADGKPGMPGTLTVVAGPITATLPTLPEEDFPCMAVPPFAACFTLPAPVLLRLFARTLFAVSVSTDDPRYYLEGVYLHAPEGLGVLRSVATDGHRLARIDSLVPKGAADMPGVIVLHKTAKMLVTALAKVTADVTVSVAKTRIQFAFGGTILSSKVIDGKYPDYNRVIPCHQEGLLGVDSAQLADAVLQVAGARPKKVTVALHLGAGAVRLVCTTDGLTAEATVSAAYTGEDLIIGFNARYLLDSLAQIKGSATLVFSAGGDPMLMQEGDDDSAIYLTMPMRV